MRPRFAIIIALCLVAGPARGTGIIKKSLAELSREAEIIARVQVRSSHAAWNHQRTLIWTTTVLDVLEVWKGKAPKRIDVREPGGIVPPVGLQVHGMARYKKGETVVVFLKRDVLGQWRTHGAFQGRIPLTRGTDGRWRTALTGVTPRSEIGAFKRRVLTLARRKKGR